MLFLDHTGLDTHNPLPPTRSLSRSGSSFGSSAAGALGVYVYVHTYTHSHESPRTRKCVHACMHSHTHPIIRASSSPGCSSVCFNVQCAPFNLWRTEHLACSNKLHALHSMCSSSSMPGNFGCAHLRSQGTQCTHEWKRTTARADTLRKTAIPQATVALGSVRALHHKIMFVPKLDTSTVCWLLHRRYSVCGLPYK
jgi:hypothetical protein